LANHNILNNIDHQNLRVITDMHPCFGGVQSYATLVLSELEDAQVSFPLFFRQTTGDAHRYEIVAVLGLDQQENVFLDENGWHAHYLPLSIKRQPFLIGFQQQPTGQEPVVCIDLDSPRISQDKGEPLFLPHGGQSGFLQDAASILMALHDGHQDVSAFIDTLVTLGLIAPIDVNIQLNNGEKVSLQQLATIDEERLRQLSADELMSLHSKGLLKSIYMMVASLGNMAKVIERKNALL